MPNWIFAETSQAAIRANDHDRETPMTARHAHPRQPVGSVAGTKIVHDILDGGFVARVSLMARGLSIAYARPAGHSTSRARPRRGSGGSAGARLCRAGAMPGGIVAARSGFRTVTCRPVIAHGAVRRAEDGGIDAITDELLPGRRGKTRRVTAPEREARGAGMVEIKRVVVKARGVPTSDDPPDPEGGTGAGVRRVVTTLRMGLWHGHTPEGVVRRPSLAAARRRFA